MEETRRSCDGGNGNDYCSLGFADARFVRHPASVVALTSATAVVHRNGIFISGERFVVRLVHRIVVTNSSNGDSID